MTTETAIVQLKNRAETAIQRAISARQQQEARELVSICDTIIDYYNQTEKQREELQNLRGLVLTLLEYIGTDPADRQELTQIDNRFFRKQLERRLPEWWQLPHWLFHFILTDWQIRKFTLWDIDNYKNFIIPMLDKLSDKEIEQWDKEGLNMQTQLQFPFSRALHEAEAKLVEMESELLD